MFSENKFKARKIYGSLPAEPIVRENLELVYCKEREVLRKRRKYILFKSTFAEKIAHLANKGRSLDLNMMSHEWINENLDMLYDRLRHCIPVK